MLTLLIIGVYLIDQLGPTYKQLQTGVREKEKVETKSESATKTVSYTHLTLPTNREV